METKTLIQAENELYSLMVMYLQQHNIPAPVGRLICASIQNRMTESAMFTLANEITQAEKAKKEAEANDNIHEQA